MGNFLFKVHDNNKKNKKGEKKNFEYISGWLKNVGTKIKSAPSAVFE